MKRPTTDDQGSRILCMIQVRRVMDTPLSRKTSGSACFVPPVESLAGTGKNLAELFEAMEVMHGEEVVDVG
jgi:hypothetical protein